jgi:hypothetical protein
MTTEKQAILDTLSKFARQRPGIEPRNYGSWKDYRSESRSVTKDLHDFHTLRRAVEWRDSITADMLKEAFGDAYSGRLACKVEPKGETFSVQLTYTTGQYFPTEYRKAACAVLSSALWYWQRANKPASAQGDSFNLGDWLRDSFRREFGRRLQLAYFN